MDQVATLPGTTEVRSRSGPDCIMYRLLRIPTEQPVIDESETHKIFSTSIFLSALRCLLSYIVAPIVLPAIGFAKGVEPIIGIPVSVLALTFDYRGIRRFWLADHHYRWWFTGLYAVVGTLVLVLMITDIVSLFH